MRGVRNMGEDQGPPLRKVMPLPRDFRLRMKNRRLRYVEMSPLWLIERGLPRLARRLLEMHADERFVEYPLVFSAIGKNPGATVLDLGCWGSPLPIQLASLGYRVVGVDVNDYPLCHPSFDFVRGDICCLPFPAASFNTVTCISTLEHVGLGRYGDPVGSDAQERAIGEMARVVCDGGRVVIAVPFGKKRHVVYSSGVPAHLVYDWASLCELMGPLRPFSEEFWIRKSGAWLRVERGEAEEAPSCSADVCSIAFLVRIKQLTADGQWRTRQT